MPIVTPSTLADGIEKGAQLPGVRQRREQGSQLFFIRKAKTIHACPIGMYVLATFPEQVANFTSLHGDDSATDVLIPYGEYMEVQHPIKTHLRTWRSVLSLVVELNDTHKWTWRRIVRWLRSLEQV